jgi:hypothetical protein
LIEFLFGDVQKLKRCVKGKGETSDRTTGKDDNKTKQNKREENAEETFRGFPSAAENEIKSEQIHRVGRERKAARDETRRCEPREKRAENDTNRER